MVKSKIRSLLGLVDLQLEVSQTKLQALHQREVKLKGLLTDLEAQKKHSIGKPQEIGMIEFRNEIKLHRWVDRRRAAINTEMAQVRALMVIQRDVVSQHFSRQQVLRNIAKNEKQAIQQKITRTAYYGP